MSEECLAKGKDKEQPREVSSSCRPPYEFDFARDGTVGNIMDAGAWESYGIDGAHRALGGLGSLGVFLLNLKNNGGVIVFKQGSSSSASELFCSLLYKELGIATPSMRVLPKAEFLKIIDQLGDVCFKEPGAGDHLQSQGKQRGAVGMQFAKGVTLKHPNIVTYLRDEVIAEKLLFQFGEVIAIDMLVNNFDRTPAIWDHEGNANNILIDVSGDGTVTVQAIDQQCTAIRDPPHEDKNIPAYLSKVRAALEEAYTKNTAGEHISRIRKFIKAWANDVDIGDKGCAHIQRGLLEAAVRIAVKNNFAELYQATITKFTDAGAAWGEPGMNTISLPFLERTADVFAEIASKMK